MSKLDNKDMGTMRGAAMMMHLCRPLREAAAICAFQTIQEMTAKKNTHGIMISCLWKELI
jgi:hypothetical protein